jgi:hypothetical protein
MRYINLIMYGTIQDTIHDVFCFIRKVNLCQPRHLIEGQR